MLNVVELTKKLTTDIIKMELIDIIGKNFLCIAEEEGVSIDQRHAEVLAALVGAVSDGMLLQWLLDPQAVPRARQVMEALAVLSPAFAGEASRPTVAAET